MALSEEAWLQACARGDRAALHHLYTETVPRLLGEARRMVRSRALAENIVRDSFILA